MIPEKGSTMHSFLIEKEKDTYTYIKLERDRPNPQKSITIIRYDWNKISAKSNTTVITRDHRFGKYQARYFFFAGKKLREKKLSGNYKLIITYQHSKGGEEKFIKNINL